MKKNNLIAVFAALILVTGCAKMNKQKEMLQGYWVCTAITGQPIPAGNTVFLEINKNRYIYSSTMNQEQGRYMLSEGKIYFIKDDRTEKAMEIAYLSADTLLLNATVTSMTFVKRAK